MTSKDWAGGQTHKVFKLMEYGIFIIPVSIWLVYATTYKLLSTSSARRFIVCDSISFTTDCVVSLLGLIGHWIDWMTILIYCLPYRRDQYKNKPRIRGFHHILIEIVTTGTNVQTIQRTVLAALNAAHHEPRVTVHVVCPEERSEDLRRTVDRKADVHGVPSSFAPSKARYKTRQLEWFRLSQQLGPEDWLLHLDEETVINKDCIQTCIDMIESQKEALIGQNLILYNSCEYWRNPICTIGDIARIAEDFGRFQWQNNNLHSPIMGIRGPFTLVNAAVENAITYDTEKLCEDWWFAFQAVDRGVKSAFLPCIAREQCAGSIMAYVKQRWRWDSGLWDLHRPWATLVLFTYGWPVFEWICFLCLVRRGYMAVPEWTIKLLALDFAVVKVGFAYACLIQDMDAQVSVVCMMWHQLLCLLISPFLRLLDAMLVVCALIFRADAFRVMRKK